MVFVTFALFVAFAALAVPDGEPDPVLETACSGVEVALTCKTLKSKDVTDGLNVLAGYERVLLSQIVHGRRSSITQIQTE
jgi:hypothetical protein